LEDITMEKIRVAVIGCGSISDIYMSNITEGKFQMVVRGEAIQAEHTGDNCVDAFKLVMGN
jgi:hypothetical protein